MGERKRAGDILALLFVTAAVVILAGCFSPYRPEEEEKPEEGPLVLVDDLFISSGQEDGKIKTVFHTNDVRYWSWKGLTAWTVWEDAASIVPFTSRTVTMSKVNGYISGGYGFVICQGERTVDEKDEVTEATMLVVMINNDGEYLIGEAIGARFTEFDWWKRTPYLQSNAGAENEVTVTYDGDVEEFSLSINGHFVEKFRDDLKPVHRQGKNGYLVVITPFDDFPRTDIEVYFVEEGVGTP
jgi:hypothetical protein